MRLGSEARRPGGGGRSLEGRKKISRGSGILDQVLPPALLNAAFSFSDKAFLGVRSLRKNETILYS